LNFKLPSVLLLLLLFNACGVKSNPIPPKGTALPDYVDQFLKVDPSKDSREEPKEEE